ncbi:hypothetical protein PGN35_013650 [Nodosilinea sp. PGN35]|uniref:hypothetical protein n=1 Tax=Nodosilinea sp. PGN35 TaxID=3020489 RepID=UPI0023B2F401|nr:hypothetical protein [Nodosilinea sp. TSF1-S3]MDF0366132.1 hypothetical protein [Nodosilinea sp. TSF1-S3]
MTQQSVPQPFHGAQPQTVTTVMQLILRRRHHEAQCYDGGETTTLIVEKLVNRAGQTLTPVWGKDWSELEPGLRTKADAIEIHPAACPVCISFKQERFGRIYNRRTYEDERYTVTDVFEVCYRAAE